MRKVLFFLFLTSYTICRADRVDSLLNRLKQDMPDTERVNTLNYLCYEKYLVDINQAIPFGKQALVIGRKANYYKGMALSWLYLSYLYHGKGEHEDALKLVDSSITICKGHGLEYLKVKGLNQKGNMYGDMGDIKTSLVYYLEASVISERYKDKKTLIGAYGNIGICFMASKQYEKSKEYLRKGIALCDEMNDIKNKGNILNNLGGVYLEEKKYDSARVCFIEGEKLFQKANYKRGLGYCNYYLGFINKQEEKLPEALQRFEKAGAIFLESGHTSELPNIYTCIAEVYLRQNQVSMALTYAKRSEEEAEKEQSGYDLKEAFHILKEIYESMGDHKTALVYYEKYVVLKDSLFNSESTAQMAEMQTKYETDKKESENKLLQEKNDSNAKTIKQQQYIGIAVGLICVLLIAFAVVIFRSNKQKQKANIELERKNHLIEKQKELVEEKQKEILDSIHYARRIQRTLLTSERYIGRNLARLNKKQ